MYPTIINADDSKPNYINGIFDVEMPHMVLKARTKQLWEVLLVKFVSVKRVIIRYYRIYVVSISTLRC